MTKTKKLIAALTAITSMVSLGVGTISASAADLDAINEKILNDTASDEEKFIAEYANGTTDKNTTIKKAYEKIYQTADRSFDYDAQLELDTCYRDIPSVCGSYFTVARKLILNAK